MAPLIGARSRPGPPPGPTRRAVSISILAVRTNFFRRHPMSDNMSQYSVLASDGSDGYTTSMPPPDPYDGYASLKSQGDSWVTIVPNDNQDLARRPKALWVDVAGTLRLRGADGNDETFSVVAGSPLSLRPVRVLSTGTNATGIKAIY